MCGKIVQKNRSYACILMLIFCSFFCGLVNRDIATAATLKTKRVGTYSAHGSAPQGMAYDKDNDVLVISAATLASCGGGDRKCNDGFYIVNLDNIGKSTFLGGRSSNIVNHANGLTYNTKIKKIIAAYSSYYYTLVYDGDRVKLLDKKRGRRSSGAIGYSASRDRYFASGGGNGKILGLSFDVLKTFNASKRGGSQQDGDAYGNYYYLISNNTLGGHVNYLDVYDMNTKKHVKEFHLSGVSGEAESIAFVDDSAYIVSNNCGSGFCLYKVADSEMYKLLKGISTAKVPTYTGTIDRTKMRKEIKRAKVTKITKDSEKGSGEYEEKKKCSAILPESWCRDENGTMKVIDLVLSVMTSGIALLAMFGMVMAGMQYAAAGGRDEMIVQAKQRIVAIVIGLTIWIFMYVFVRWLLLGKI
jgi:hypothetical protein